jgi:transaldolase
MRPQNLKSRIFLDGGNPDETREIISVLGFLDGQTTNPTLISKNPLAKKRLAQGDKFTNKQEYDIAHDLTVKGMEKFSKDWNDLVVKPVTTAG